MAQAPRVRRDWHANIMSCTCFALLLLSQRCIAISTRAALKYMMPPGALVMLAPLVAGTFFGVYAVCGLLTGGMASGVQVRMLGMLCPVYAALQPLSRHFLDTDSAIRQL